ncbi:uncharacterized protein FIBRA_01994 [Fibroporia radiculosa]|uniref:Uncharacterized protein n=1 Tax=Fibroporia radiculosa TaxID=599839 RepID=J4H1K7_9APHY|nr:uncharacterized protein FIBRA_01994 [Fibroporia radiculosa]CCL99969.1 predicted protein [Fibroporia radiculosa]
MVKYYDEISPELAKWVEEQQMFWVASAPLTGDGHVNLSPKGLQGTFHIVNPNKVWYEDCTGSGSETMAHIREPGNGRVTIMFCAFEGPPRIMRLFCKGTVYEFGTIEYQTLLPPEKRLPGSRSAVVLDVYKVQTSCGYAVPLYNFVTHRPTLLNWTAQLAAADIASHGNPESADMTPDWKVPEKGLKAYWARMNTESLDGLPAMKDAHISAVAPTHAPSEGRWGKDVTVRTIYEFGTAEFDTLVPADKRLHGSRFAVVLDVYKIQTSCGFGGPLYSFVAHRPTLNWSAQLAAADLACDAEEESPSEPPKEDLSSRKSGLKAYWAKTNVESLGGLTAIKSAHVSDVTPAHAPPSGEWSKDAQAALTNTTRQTGVNSKVVEGASWITYAEVMMVLSAFLMGLAVSAMYVEVACVTRSC